MLVIDVGARQDFFANHLLQIPQDKVLVLTNIPNQHIDGTKLAVPHCFQIALQAACPLEQGDSRNEHPRRNSAQHRQNRNQHRYRKVEAAFHSGDTGAKQQKRAKGCQPDTAKYRKQRSGYAHRLVFFCHRQIGVCISRLL